MAIARSKKKMLWIILGVVSLIWGLNKFTPLQRGGKWIIIDPNTGGESPIPDGAMEHVKSAGGNRVTYYDYDGVVSNFGRKLTLVQRGTGKTGVWKKVG